MAKGLPESLHVEDDDPPIHVFVGDYFGEDYGEQDFGWSGDQSDSEDEQEEPINGQSSNPKAVQKPKRDVSSNEDSEVESEEEEEPAGAPITIDTSDDTRILTVEELEAIFCEHAFNPDGRAHSIL